MQWLHDENVQRAQNLVGKSYTVFQRIVSAENILF